MTKYKMLIIKNFYRKLKRLNFEKKIIISVKWINWWLDNLHRLIAIDYSTKTVQKIEFMS